MPPLRLAEQGFQRPCVEHPLRLMRFVEHAALRDRLAEQRHQFRGAGRRLAGDRLVGVERRRLRLLAAFAARQQFGDEARRARQRGLDRRPLAAGGGLALASAAGDQRQREAAVVVDDFQFERVAGLGRERQRQRHVALVDQRPVGAVRQQGLDLGEHPLPGNEVGERVGNLLRRRDAGNGGVGRQLQATGDFRWDHLN
ncbi:hypothetical protein [Azospira restricta]|uniref:hypothetical protein n=1 Tax=Azospira restricta TaxID=404405 RepID=UPI00361D7365